MKKIILLFGLLVTCWQINAQDYCTDGGPSSTNDTNVEAVDFIGETTTIAYLGCQNAGNGVTGVEDLTGSQSADVVAGNSYTADVQFGTCGGNYASLGEAWIDFDRDGFFEPSESIGTVTGIAPFALQSFTVNVPSDAINGSTRMRVMQREGGTLPLDPCGSFTYGSVVDFEVVISGGIDVTCEQPFNVQLVEAFGSSADFSWDLAPNDQNGYIWEVFTAGADPDVDTPVSTGTVGSGVSTANADGLSELTDYDFYVTTDCGATDGLSQRSNVVTFTTVFLCPAPSNVTVDGVVSDAFNINWNEIPNAANGYTWSVFNAGDDPTIDTPVFTGTEPFGTTSTSVTGLTDNTSYDVYVSADCDVDGTSELSNVVTVTTPCTALSAPITENFDGASWVSGTGFNNTGDAIDNCWQRTPGQGTDFFWGTRSGTTGSTGTGPSVANSTPNYIFTEGSNGSVGDEAFFVSPLIDLSPLTAPALTFWYHMFGDNMGTLSVDVDAGSGFDLDVFTISGQQQVAESDAFIEQIVDLSAYAGQTVTIRFRGVKGDGFESDMAIDDFKVDEAPSCLKTFNLALVEAFDVEAEVSWSLIGNATNGYIWEVYNAGDDPTTATPVSTGTFAAGITSGLLTGLTELTDYDLYIISDCGVDGTSDLAGPLSFSTLATCPSPSNIAVTNITENSADITWDESFNASNGYNWELFLDGEDPATATPTQSGNVAFGTTTLNLTGLSDNVDYDFYITSDCDTDGLSVTEGPISFLTLPLPPVNDDICDAIPLTVGVIPPSDTYTNLGATAQTDEPEGTCFNGGLNGSVWFTFVAPASGEVEVSTDIAGATLTDTEIAVYDAPTDCADPTTMGAELGCDQDGGTVIGFNSIVNLSGLTGGTTYYIQVDQWGTTTPGDFGISVIDTNPPCPVPENITLNSVSNTTADFSWDDVTEATDGYNWFVFNQGADVTTDSPVATGNVGVGVLNTSASGLTSNTVYDFYVQSDCGSTNGISALGNPLTFTTDCDSFTAPYFNDFEAFPVTTNLTVEDCWNEVSLGSFTWDVGTGGTGSLNTGPSGALSGNNYVFTEASSGSQGDEAILLSPSLDLSTLAEPTLSFWYHMYGADIGTLAVDVKTSTSANFDLDVFTLSGEQQTAETDSWIQQFVDLSTYAGETIQFRFRVIRGNGFAGDVAIEDVLIDEAPSCFTPTGLSVDSVGNDSVNVSWDDTPSAIDGYEILVFADGDDPDTDTPFATANEPAGVTSTTITGLTGLTTYQVYILSDCGAVDGQSLLSNGITFTTLCDPFVAPFVEDFNTNGTNIPSCWEQAGNTSKDWLFTDPPSFSHVGDSGTLGGSTASNGGLAWVDDSSPNVLDTRLHSPLIDVSSLSVPFLSFYLISNNEGFSNVDFRVEVWDGAAWNEVFFSNSNTFNGEWEEIQIELSTLTFTGNAQIAFIVDENNGTDFYDDVAIDDVRLEEAPACPKPGNIAIIDVFFDSLEVSWNSVSNASNGYIWEVYNAGDDPAVDTPVSTGTFASGTTQGVADGLLPETDYDFYMISDCGATDGQSVLTNPITFTTTELCSLPSTFEVTNVLPDSAELTWTPIPNAINGYLWAIFNAGDDPATATPVVSGTAASGDTSVIATGLTDNSDYEAYITTDCGPSDGQSIQSQPVAFSTPCTVFTAPYFNDFEAFPVTTNLTEEDCWIEDSSGSFGWDVGTGGTGSLNTGPSGALSGNNYVFTEASSGTQGDEAILLSPLVDLSTLTQPALSFWYHMYGADMGTLAVDVKISTSANFDLDVFTLSGEQQTAETDSWIQQFVDLSTYAGETIQFRFRVTRGNGFTGDAAIEDVLIDEAPSCLTPTGLTVSNITETTADLSWSVIGNATSGYNWFVFNAGDDPDVDTPVASGSTAAGVTTANVTNLPSSSFLEAYIQSNCGATDGLSELSPAVSFETLCDVIPTPYFEDFENFTVSTSFDEDGCWNEESLGSFTWDVGTGNTGSLNTGPDAAFSGLNYLFSEASSGSQGDEAIVLSPQVDLSNLTTPAVSFRYHMYGADIDQLSVDIDDGTTLDLDVFTIVGEQQTSETDDWVQVFVDLMPYAGQTIQVRFRVTRGDGYEGDVAIDDVNFDEAPTCFDPLNLEVISVTDISADLSWQAGSTETNFDVEVVPAGTPPTGTPTFEDVSVPFTATGLTSETDYDFYVRADCGPGDVSNWIGPEGFTTALTPVTVVVNDPAINNTYCYDNNEFKEWLFVSSDIQITPPTPVEVIFNGGTIEDGTGSTDRFRVFNGFDQTAPVLYDSDVQGTDLSGVTLSADSGAMYMLLESDIFGSCQSGVDIEVPFDFDVFAGVFSTVAFSDNNFKYYPNPVSSTMTIDSANPIESVQVFDILGKEVFSNNYEETSININMDALSSGTYLMKVSISGNSQTFRVIKD